MAAATGALAWPLAELSPLFGTAIVAALLGVAVAWALPGAASTLRPGASRTAKVMLQASIVVLGATMSPADLEIGWPVAVVVLGSAGTAIVVVLAARASFGVDRATSTLLAAGTSICGATAVATTASVLRARAEAVTSALATVLVGNLIAVLTFPAIGHLLGLSQESFGIWAATAVHDTASVLATASAFGPDAAEVAVVVKLARTLLLIPFVVVVAARTPRGADASGTGIARLLPPFIVAFVVAIALNAVGVIPTVVQPVLRTVASAGITVALAGFGLTADRASILAGGPRALALGGTAWVVVAITALGLQWVLGLT